MAQVNLPSRVGPKHGTYAFTSDGERQIYDAVKVHGMHPMEVAVEIGASLVTVYAIVKREHQRRESEGCPDPSRSGRCQPETNAPAQTPEAYPVSATPGESATNGEK